VLGIVRTSEAVLRGQTPWEMRARNREEHPEPPGSHGRASCPKHFTADAQHGTYETIQTFLLYCFTVALFITSAKELIC